MLAYEPDSDVEPDEDEDEDDFIEELEPGASIKVPYGFRAVPLGNDGEGINFSTIRHFVLEDRDNWMKRQTWMKETFLERVFSNWLKYALLSDALPGLKIMDYDRCNAPYFQGRRWDWINPLQDAKANTESINNRTKSPQQIIREQGKDPDEVLSEITEWHEKTKHLTPLEVANEEAIKEESS